MRSLRFLLNSFLPWLIKPLQVDALSKRKKKHSWVEQGETFSLNVAVWSQNFFVKMPFPNHASPGVYVVSVKMFYSYFLLQHTCVLAYNGSNGRAGTYAVALTLEDFPKGTNNFNSVSPFSAVGLQFLVIISGHYGSCGDVPVFTASTPSDGQCSEVQIGSAYKAVIEVKLADLSKQYVFDSQKNTYRGWISTHFLMRIPSWSISFRHSEDLLITIFGKMAWSQNPTLTEHAKISWLTLITKGKQSK